MAVKQYVEPISVSFGAIYRKRVGLKFLDIQRLNNVIVADITEVVK